MDRFAAKHGSCRCRDLLGDCDLLTEEGQRHYKASDLLHKTCIPCLQTVGEILEDMLQ